MITVRTSVACFKGLSAGNPSKSNVTAQIRFAKERLNKTTRPLEQCPLDRAEKRGLTIRHSTVFDQKPNTLRTVWNLIVLQKRICWLLAEVKSWAVLSFSKSPVKTFLHVAVAQSQITLTVEIYPPASDSCHCASLHANMAVISTKDTDIMNLMHFQDCDDGELTVEMSSAEDSFGKLCSQK